MQIPECLLQYCAAGTIVLLGLLMDAICATGGWVVGLLVGIPITAFWVTLALLVLKD